MLSAANENKVSFCHIYLASFQIYVTHSVLVFVAPRTVTFSFRLSSGECDFLGPHVTSALCDPTLARLSCEEIWPILPER